MIQRISIVIGACCGLVVFIWHIFCERDLLYSAWQTAIVVLTAALISHASIRWIGNIVLNHLKQKQQENQQKRQLDMPETNDATAKKSST